MIKKPIYTDRILSYVDTPFVKVLTGIRRCGKSTILKMLIDELKKRGIHDDQILHYSFDSLEYTLTLLLKKSPMKLALLLILHGQIIFSG